MHTLWLFFAWPGGLIWSNVLAMPVCGVLAALAAFVTRDRIGRALKGWYRRHLGHHAELDEIRSRLEVHADMLDPHTPGGMATLLAEVRDARAEAAAARAEVAALVAIVKPAPRRGTTEMRPTRGGKG